MSRFVTRKTHMENVDPSTGEIVGYYDSVTVEKVPSEPFFLTFSKAILALYGKSIFNNTTKVFWKLLEYAEYNTGTVYMNSQRKKELMKECNISIASYNRAIKELAECEIINKNGSTYTIDSNMFWKGDRKTREKLIKEASLKISFDAVFPDDNKPDQP